MDPDIISFVLVIGWEEDFGATERLGKEEDFVHCRGGSGWSRDEPRIYYEEKDS